MDKSTIIHLIHQHIAQRSGLDWRDYGSRESARADYSDILRQGRDARAMLRAVELSSITAEAIKYQLECGGHLSLVGDRLEYVTGQYFPTEYRAAACRLLASLLIDHYGRDGWPKDNGKTVMGRAHDWAKRNLGRAIANRWF